MNMTRKDYVLISNSIKSWYLYATANNSRVDKDHALNLAESMALSLKADNPRFDEQKFLAACGL